ncbi:MAG: MBL fold metallo-hydrolase [Proteobacteria bacterium]|nr:MBL fold metallo-hydrolase [Pseudomonadota bacterium]MBU1716205.1 MBL fold metallo-hydrolase [Pseudomonadota bacterium]
MRFCVLGSGSKGNATYVESGDTRILIDAGFSGIEVERRLAVIGVDLSSISAILVTHEHSDHIKGVSILSRRYKLPVLTNKETLSGAGKNLSQLYAWQEIATGTSFHFQDLEIHPFSISHDAADPVGYVIGDGCSILGYCTDTGITSRLMKHRLTGCHGLVLEFNHDPELLRNGPYPPHLQQRVRSKSGHLANGEAAEFLAELMHEGLEHVVLAHISEANNHHEVINRAVARCRVGVDGGCRAMRISIARQDQVGEVIMLSGGAFSVAEGL